MNRIGTEIQTDAARHEAGHAVVGIRSGCKPSSIHIRLDGDRWFGDCGFERQKVSAEDMAAIAIAGCLAQAKSVAQREHTGHVSFSKKAGLKELILILRDADRSSPESEPGTCDLALVVDEKDATIRFDGAWFSGADAGQYRMVRKSLFPIDSTDIQLIRSVMEELDEERNWRAVCVVAEVVCRQPLSEEGKLVLDGGTVLALIEQEDRQANA